MIAVVLYLWAIVGANALVATYGPAVSVLNAFVFIAFDLALRDALHERWEGNGLRWRMAGLIAAGGALSYLLNQNAGPIALASFLAFSTAAAADSLVYTRLRQRPYLQRANGSNAAGAVLDSVVFSLVAFGWPPLWPVLLGQIIAKLAGGALWSLVFAYLRRPAPLRG